MAATLGFITALWEGRLTTNHLCARLKPDPRLTPAKRKIVVEDYGMERGALRITTRGPLLQYALNQLQLDPHVLTGKPSAQQIVIDNFDAIKSWLFT